MEVSAQYLTLQNDNFMERHVKFYKKIREEEDLLDVTIACDGAEVRAHKLIMSASSPLFKRIIKNSSHPDPYIYLQKLHPQDLTSIINFVYTGETKVEANSIQRFMTSASDLQISGLVSEAPPEAPDKVETELDEELVLPLSVSVLLLLSRLVAAHLLGLLHAQPLEFLPQVFLVLQELRQVIQVWSRH